MLLVARLLGVYFAAALASCFLTHRFVRRLTAPAAAFLLLTPFLLAGTALVSARVFGPIDLLYGADPLHSHAAEVGITGARTPLLTDVVSSMIPWRKAVREAVKNGRLPLWNRFVLGGEPLLAVQQHGMFHPTAWIGFLLPLAHGWTVEMALRLFLALLAGYLFFREIVETELPAWVGAAGWAFCGFLIFWMGYPLSPAIGVFPLLLLGLRRLARGPGRDSIGLTVTALVLTVIAGHPESLLHCVAAGGVYFLFELAGAPPSLRLPALGASLASGALALGLTAVVLLPFAEALPSTFEQRLRTAYFARSVRSVSWNESAHLALANVVPYANGLSGSSRAAPGREVPAGYAGALILPLAVLGLLSRRRERWIFFLLAFCGALLGARVKGPADWIARLPLFDIALNERLVFLAAFGTVGLAVLALEDIEREHGRARFAAASLASAAVIALLFWRMRPRVLELGMAPAELSGRLSYQLVPLLAAAAAAAFARSHRVFGAALLAILLASRWLESGRVYPTLPSRAFYPPLRAFEPIARDGAWRFAGVGMTLIPNTATLYELEDVRGYESMTLASLVETFPLWCVPQPIWFNRVDDPTRPFLSFLNVRYFFASRGRRPSLPRWPVLYEGDDGVLLENPRALPRFFVPRHWLAEPDPVARLTLLGRIEDFSDRGIVSEPVGSASWQPNGEASIRIVSCTSGRARIEIDARQPALIASSLTCWPGWKLRVDGRRMPLLTYNHAFHAFRVSAGTHVAELDYLPDGFRRGATISLGTALAWIVVVLVRRLRRPSEGSPGPPRPR